MSENAVDDSLGLPRLGIIISMFPELHETFILRELVALEKRGVRFDIYSLQYPRDPITLDDALRLSKQRTHYAGLLTPKTISAFLKTLVQHPIAVLKAIMGVIVHGYDRPKDVVKNLAILPLTLHITRHGARRGITHWHGHWANIPTTACWYIGQIFGQSWSAAIHGEDIFSPNRFLQYKLNDAEFAVVCSDYFCQHLKTRMHLSRPERIHLNYHGLDPRVTQRDAATVESVSPVVADGARELFSIVSIGRLVPTKGHDIVMRACAALIKQGVNLQWHLIGSGPLQSELESLAATLGITPQVQFHGALAFESVLQRLERADVFALAPRMIPGHPPDGIPNVIAEAMALGVPVVSTRVSAIPELVSHAQTGTLVEVDDIEAFALALNTLLNDTTLRHQYSEAARQRVDQLFNQNNNIDDLLNLFEQYLSERYWPVSAVAA